MKDWEEFLTEQEQEFGKETVDRWLRSLQMKRFDACNLYLEAKDSFQMLWFEEHIRHKLSRLVTRNNSPITVHLSLAGASSVKPAKKSGASKQAPASAPLFFNSLDPHCSFEHFLISEENTLTLHVLEENSAVYNPVYLYGPPGSGKTHLLMAITHKMRQNGLKAIYARAELFCDHVVKSIRAQEMNHFRNTYRNADILLIDDVHQLAKKSATQEEFFHTFNALHIAGKKIVLSANVPPQALTQIEPRLISRFEWGISLPLVPLHSKDLVRLIEKKALLLNYPLTARTAEFLAETFSTSPKSCMRALDALVLRSHLQHKNKKAALTLSDVKSLLSDLIDKEKFESISFERIIQTVSDHYGLPQEEVYGKSQSRECVLPRQMAMYLCRHLLKMPFMKIGDLFSRDHSTVMSAIRQFQTKLNLIESDVAASCSAISRTLQSRG